MKLAIVDYRIENKSMWVGDHIRKSVINPLTKKGVEIYTAPTIREFEERYGSLDAFDGLLYHPGLQEQETSLPTISTNYPELKWALATLDPGDGLHDQEVPVLSYWYAEKIFDHFCVK